MNISALSDPATSQSSATQIAHSKLRDLILTGELAPGTKLKIDHLRKILGTGASPIREALSLLTSDQLVVRHEQRGFSAAATSSEDFAEILRLRCSLEGMALRQSMENKSDDWIESLVIIHHRMSRLQQSKSDDFEREHKNFHMALIGNCDSPLLLRFCNQLYDLNIRYRFIAGRSIDYKGRKVEDEHRIILDAVIAGDIDHAEDLLRSHYETTGAFLKAFIK
ncbi:GntR family transcriptional regulator [Octadecabacter sp. 1_MG-2023]|uniref:GntR family transcriptional regulator n=1 Tax=unclassified Octadecabacter TaxID=196158 RepID=UPI001C086C83|nr:MULTISPECIES: GntR family transcriptional regulator [unclassified Octadecabacter]MBU2994006.1 GntR family transcriptional regulator [Octadecabacter sp. B2R22]MDO6736051.1 GntR family transcriptional regulator [Octadecabacter sp. 1_MG-2023]